MGKIISFVNQKGGVGKTTSAVNVAACLGILGYRTLLIDLDPQGNATTGVKIAKKNLKYTVCDLLTGSINPADAVIQTEYDKLWVMPANGRLANAEFELYNGEEPVLVMQKALASLKTVFDYIIVDCPPSLGMLTVNSLTASDGVVVPMQCEFYALEGLSQLSKTIRTVHDNYNSALNITGILLTMYTKRLLLTQQVERQIEKHYGGKLFSTPITRSVKLSEAPGYGEPIYYYDKSGKGTKEYLSVANELASRV